MRGSDRLKTGTGTCTVLIPTPFAIHFCTSTSTSIVLSGSRVATTTTKRLFAVTNSNWTQTTTKQIIVTTNYHLHNKLLRQQRLWIIRFISHCYHGQSSIWKKIFIRRTHSPQLSTEFHVQQKHLNFMVWIKQAPNASNNPFSSIYTATYRTFSNLNLIWTLIKQQVKHVSDKRLQDTYSRFGMAH